MIHNQQYIKRWPLPLRYRIGFSSIRLRRRIGRRGGSGCASDSSHRKMPAGNEARPGKEATSRGEDAAETPRQCPRHSHSLCVVLSGGIPWRPLRRWIGFSTTATGVPRLSCERIGRPPLLGLLKPIKG